MYQTYASAEHDLPSISAAVRKGPTFLYLEVENLDAIKSAVKGAEVYLPERTTFYGAKEIGVKDPAGHFITSPNSPNLECGSSAAAFEH